MPYRVVCHLYDVDKPWNHYNLKLFVFIVHIYNSRDTTHLTYIGTYFSRDDIKLDLKTTHILFHILY